MGVPQLLHAELSSGISAWQFGQIMKPPNTESDAAKRSDDQAHSRKRVSVLMSTSKRAGTQI